MNNNTEMNKYMVSYNNNNNNNNNNICYYKYIYEHNKYHFDRCCLNDFNIQYYLLNKTNIKLNFLNNSFMHFIYDTIYQQKNVFKFESYIGKTELIKNISIRWNSLDWWIKNNYKIRAKN